MELRELQYILTIAECGSISKASQQLYIAQSSLSQFLKNYEIQCGYPLFIRTSKGLCPTREGELYIHTARQMMRLQKDLDNQLMELSELKRGKVVFSLSPFRSPYLLPVVMPYFRKIYPNISIQIVEADMNRQERLLAEGNVDVAFLSLPLLNQDIPYREIVQEEYFLAVPRNHSILAKAKKYPDSNRCWIEIEDLDGQDFLLCSVISRFKMFSEGLFRDNKITPNIIQEHENFETLIRLAEAGMGMTFLPETYIGNSQKLEYLSIGESGEFRTLVLGYPTKGYLSKATQVFSDIVMEKVLLQHEKLMEMLK